MWICCHEGLGNSTLNDGFKTDWEVTVLRNEILAESIEPVSEEPKISCKVSKKSLNSSYQSKQSLNSSNSLEGSSPLTPNNHARNEKKVFSRPIKRLDSICSTTSFTHFPTPKATNSPQRPHSFKD